eukprot:jgi/Chlat1/8791/Chrsp90S00680
MEHADAMDDCWKERVQQLSDACRALDVDFPGSLSEAPSISLLDSCAQLGARAANLIDKALRWNLTGMHATGGAWNALGSESNFLDVLKVDPSLPVPQQYVEFKLWHALFQHNAVVAAVTKRALRDLRADSAAGGGSGMRMDLMLQCIESGVDLFSDFDKKLIVDSTQVKKQHKKQDART